MTLTSTVVRTELIIDGEWRRPTGGDETAVRNPANPEEIVGYAAEGTRQDAALAVASAQAAFPGWSALSFQERAGYLHTLVSGLDTRLEERVELLVRENGKIRREATVEMTRLGDRFRYTASLAQAVAEEEEHRPPPPLHTLVAKDPLGVVTLIIPYNWPLSILAAKLPQALLAGNTVVIKPSPQAPLALTQTVKLMADALPAGVINLVTGPTGEVGAELVENPAVRKVDFTGSVESGRQVMRAAAATLKRLTLELGGNDPGIVLDDVEVTEALAQRMVTGAFMTAGQICMALKRLYVHEAVYAQLLEALGEVLSRYVVGNGLDPASTMGPLNNQAQQRRVQDLLDDSRQRGARVLDFGAPLDEAEFRRGWFQLPSLVTEVDQSADLVRHEQFGPVLPLIPFRREEDALAMANDSEYGLCSSVWSADIERAVALARRIEAGVTYINNHGPMAQDNRAPFGGVKNSGIGRQLGLQGVVEFLNYHTISIPA
jgi:acyl-CoA reductase-like NAD-dependent aldehyde dehydrogenase